MNEERISTPQSQRVADVGNMIGGQVAETGSRLQALALSFSVATYGILLALGRTDNMGLMHRYLIGSALLLLSLCILCVLALQHYDADYATRLYSKYKKDKQNEAHSKGLEHVIIRVEGRVFAKVLNRIMPWLFVLTIIVLDAYVVVYWFLS